MVGAVRDAAEVSGDGKAAVVVLHVESGIVAAVVHHFKCRDREIAYREGYLLVDGGVVVLYAARHIVAA